MVWFRAQPVEFRGVAGTGHGGGLRGWRSERFYLPAQRLSVVVLFNHMYDPRAAAMDLLDAATGTARPPAPPSAPPDRTWEGTYLEPETRLIVQCKPVGDHKLHLDYARPELLEISTAVASNSGTVLSMCDDGLWMERRVDHLRTRLEPISGESRRDIEGMFHSAELDSSLHILCTDGVLYGVFAGWLGHGIVQPLLPVGADLWRLPCPRALDFAAPGDWTVAVRRSRAGAVTAIEVGCWLARQVIFTRA